MIGNKSNNISNWLQARDKEYKKAVEQASQLILEPYLQLWPELIPIQLDKLASTCLAEIVYMPNLKENVKREGFLLPRENGFQIIVKGGMFSTSYRTTIAHEIAHTLFYSNPEEGKPRRLVPQSKREEIFCFDVARHLLAPEQHIQAIGILKERDPQIIFGKLVKNLLLSRALAARIMLTDYVFVKGIAGRWVKNESGWKKEYGIGSPSTMLDPEIKKELQNAVLEYLDKNKATNQEYQIFGIRENKGGGVFVVGTLRSSR